MLRPARGARGEVTARVAGVRAELHRDRARPAAARMGASCSRRPRGDAVLIGRAGRARGGRTGRAARTPWIVTVRDGGRLVGLAPLVLARRGPFRVLTRARPPARQLLERAGESRPRARLSATAVAGAVLEHSPTSGTRCCWAGCGRDRRPSAALRAGGLRRAQRAAHPIPRHRAAGHVRRLPAGPAAQAPQGPAAAHAPARRRPARAARRHASPPSCARRSTAGRRSACAGGRAAASAWTPSTPARGSGTSCGTWSSELVPRGPGTGMGAPPRRRGGGRRGQPDGRAPLLLLDGRVRPRRSRISASASSRSGRASGRASRRAAPTTT